MRAFLLVGVLLGAALPVNAATIIVDAGHPKAADTSHGSREAPLKTIGAAAKKVQPGDTVLVRPGIYREAVTLTVSGKEGQPIVFRSEMPHGAVISGSDVVTDWKPEAPGVWSMAAPDLKKNRYGNAEWVYVDGYPLQRAESRGQLAPGAFFQDFERGRVFVAPEEGRRIEDAKVEYARREGLLYTAQPLDDIHILGFTLIHNADWFRGRRALTVSGRRWLVENNHILWASYAGVVSSRSNRCVIRDNLIEWCGDAGIGGGSNVNLLVEGNRVQYCNWRRINPSFEGGGSKWVFTLDSIVRRNEFAYNHGWAIWFDIANCNNVYAENVTHDNSVCGLFSEISWDDVLRDNVSFNQQYGIVVGESPGTVVQRNIVFNNDVGIRMRGNYRRTNSDQGKSEEHQKSVRAIPGIDPMQVERWDAGYLKYWRAQKAFLLNNCAIWENVVFDNATNYFEHRDYARPSPTDPFINNFSDYNLFHAKNPEAYFRHGGGPYAGLAQWQKVSGRDEHSVDADPRAPQTHLPAWAAAKRALWDRPFRSREEIKALGPGLVDSPMAQEALGRLLRSSYARPLALSDRRIKAFLFEVDGQHTLGLWTTQEAERRYLRLKPGRNKVTVENGYGGKRERALPEGTIDLAVTFVPTYLRGVDASVAEAPASTLIARSFSLPDQPVPVTATLVNDGKAARTLTASFSASAGFAATPPRVTRQLKPGEKAQVNVVLKPDGSFRRGIGQSRMDAVLGKERITRTASFSVGEGGGKLAFSARPLAVDGSLDDWKALGDPATVGVVAESAQHAGGDRARWGGPSDLGAKIHAAWSKDALYVAVAVSDDAIVPAPKDGSPWDYDAVELFVDGRSSEMQWQKEPTEGVYQIGISPAAAGGQPTVKVLAKTALRGLVTASSRTAGGYITEMMIPLTPQNFPAGEWQAGRTVKLSVLVDDKDDPGASARDNTFGWSFSPEGRNHADTSGWKTLLLEQ